jgi:hypothetical protein
MSDFLHVVIPVLDFMLITYDTVVMMMMITIMMMIMRRSSSRWWWQQQRWWCCIPKCFTANFFNPLQNTHTAPLSMK